MTYKKDSSENIEVTESKITQSRGKSARIDIVAGCQKRQWRWQKTALAAIDAERLSESSSALEQVNDQDDNGDDEQEAAWASRKHIPAPVL